MLERPAHLPKPLSHHLTALKLWYDECLLNGAEMTFEGAREFSRQLGAAIERAGALEDGIKLAKDVVEAFASAPPPEPDNVVVFPRRPFRRVPIEGGAA